MQKIEFKKNKLVMTTIEELKITENLKDVVNSFDYNGWYSLRRIDPLSKEYKTIISLCYKLENFGIIKEVKDAWVPEFTVVDKEKFAQLKEMCNAN